MGNYTLGKLVGKGSFGKVYLATHKLTNGTKVLAHAPSRAPCSGKGRRWSEYGNYRHTKMFHGYCV